METVQHDQLADAFASLVDQHLPPIEFDPDLLFQPESIQIDEVMEETTEVLLSHDEIEVEADAVEIPQIDEELLWQARTGLSEDSLSGAIETIIFMNDRPVPLAKIRNLIDECIPLRVVHESIAKLQEEYERKHHGIRLLEVAEGFQFRTKATYSKYVQDLFKVNSLVLTPSALEVLAIIAYKQPVSKVEVEKIRGVDSSHLVRQLMDKRLVRVLGRSDEMGRPVVYGTTPEFLEVFNLADLSQLPPERELEDMAQTDVGKIADIKTICSGDKSRFLFDEFEELEALSASINDISPETEFTRSLKVEEKKRLTEEGVVVKSAFDLLEEFVAIKSISLQNSMASVSESMLPAIEPKVIEDLSVGPFNLPELEEEDFEMIDLETGEAIAALEESSIEDDLCDDEDDDEEDVELLCEDDSDAEEEEEEDYLFASDSKSSVRDASSLEAALDAAFANITNFDFDSLGAANLGSEEELEEEQRSLDRQVEEIDGLTEEMMGKANEFELDLSFLKSMPVDGMEMTLH